MPQIPLPNFTEQTMVSTREQLLKSYLSDDATSVEARILLELKYADILTVTNEFNRKLVSFQANKKAKFHSWLKYKEGFSAELVEILLDKFGVTLGDHVL